MYTNGLRAVIAGWLSLPREVEMASELKGLPGGEV